MKIRMRYVAMCGALAVCFGAAGAVRAEMTPPKVVLPPTVEGDWVRTDETGADNYQVMTMKYPKAMLTSAGQRLLAQVSADPTADGELNGHTWAFLQLEVEQPTNVPHAVGQPYVVKPKPCAFRGGFGALEFDSAGLHAVRSKSEFVLSDELAGNARHIYLDGRPLPAPGSRAPTNTGFSAGHIDADGTLVVTTVDMTPGIVTGRGVRTPQTVLTQRFAPSADGTKLKVTYTWEDPALYTKPHTYEHTFERMPDGAVAYEDYCDASNPHEGESITPPEQK